MISAVSMTPAAIVDFAFFFEISSMNSLIICCPVSGLFAPKIAATKSNTQGAQHSPNVGLPGRSVTRSDLNTCSA